MRISAIDIGTNTVLLLVADVDETGTITPAAYEQRIPRLGRDVDAKKIIGKPAFERVAAVLREYKEMSERLQSEQLIAVGTSAVRDAANKEEFLSFIKNEAGIVIEVLSGEEEAKLAFFGAVSGLHLPVPTSRDQAGITDKQIAVIDIGGGSTEITAGTREKILIKVSLEVGSVRVTERFLRHDPPTTEELQKATTFVESALNSLPEFDFSNAVVIGVAGTATTLAALDQGLMEFNREKITGYELTQNVVEHLYDKLRAITPEQIRALSSVTHGREDILTAGTLILYEFMKKVRADELIVSERGVRYGVVLREWEKVKEKGPEGPKDSFGGCLSVGTKCSFGESFGEAILLPKERLRRKESFGPSERIGKKRKSKKPIALDCHVHFHFFSSLIFDF